MTNTQPSTLKPPVLKGCIRNVIVVKSPCPMFSEATFVLKDDYFSNPSLSRRELLQQAKDAAASFSASLNPPAKKPVWIWPVISAVLSALLTYILT